MYKKLANLAGNLTDFIFPALCHQCNSKVTKEFEYFCEDCWKKLDLIKIEDLANLYRQKFGESDCLKSLVSLFYFDEDGIGQKIIHLIKYEHFKNLGKKMGRMLAEKMVAWNNTDTILIPIPLHKTKKRERGFNQSEIISKGVCEFLNIPLRNDILVRKKYTLSQTKLKREERIANVGNAFEIKGEHDLKKYNIFLLDDVITTGSTISSCARILKSSEPKSIIAVSLAYVKP
jgi:competence protein ComFC